MANGNLAGDNFYDGTASIACHPGYEGGGSLTCQSSGAWGAKPSCNPKSKCFLAKAALLSPVIYLFIYLLTYLF